MVCLRTSAKPVGVQVLGRPVRIVVGVNLGAQSEKLGHDGNSIRIRGRASQHEEPQSLECARQRAVVVALDPGESASVVPDTTNHSASDLVDVDLRRGGGGGGHFFVVLVVVVVAWVGDGGGRERARGGRVSGWRRGRVTGSGGRRRVAGRKALMISGTSGKGSVWGRRVLWCDGSGGLALCRGREKVSQTEMCAQV